MIGSPLHSYPTRLNGALLAAMASAGLLAGCAFPQEPSENPVELGLVEWERDLDSALRRSREEGKPVFALFQEIPGCATCRNFGKGPLSHPLLVEAIETLFIPVAVYNNRPGRDAEVLAQFGEPSWNNPVVRFLDSAGGDLIPRRDGVWSTPGIAQRARASLAAGGHETPAWLTLFASENAPELARTTFSMHCFWQGAARLGGLDGVATTSAGWANGREVVEVQYDPARLDLAALTAHAQQNECRPMATKSARDAKRSDRKYFLQHSPMRLLPLTPSQQTKVNSSLALGDDPLVWLSARQKALASRIAAVSKQSPSRLEGLVAPEDGAGLAAYERKLLSRLAR